MAEPSPDPYSSNVSRRERLSSAFGDISWTGWLRGGFVGVITGLVMGEFSMIPVIAGFAAAGFVLLAQLVGNYAERAEPQILRKRLDAARRHLRNLERVITERVATMVAVAAYGQNIAALGEHLHPDNPHSGEEYEVWKKGLDRFMHSLAADVKPVLADHEWLRLRDAPDDGQLLPRGQLDEYHRHEMRKLRFRLQALQSLIDSDTRQS